MSGVAERVLTRRQEAILIATAKGLVGKHIARDMGISRSLLRHEQRALMAKLGADNAPHAVAVAYEIGLLPGVMGLAEHFDSIVRVFPETAQHLNGGHPWT